jgi:hypothetical protein
MTENIKNQVKDLIKLIGGVLQEANLKERIGKIPEWGYKKINELFLKREKKELIRKLGEQTYRLIEQGMLKSPRILKATFDRIASLHKKLKGEEEDWEKEEKKKKEEKKESKGP